MTRPFEPEDGPSGEPAAADGRATAEATALPTTCPRCQALEGRIAALEAEVTMLRAAVVTPAPDGDPEPPRATLELPRLDFKALRLFPQAWGAG